MEYTTLPNSDISVSKICLGTMTFGEQNTESQAFEQMDYAISQGVNFFDTAELYAIPAKPETYGDTERIIGNWFKKNKNRDKVVLASKIAGPATNTTHIRTCGYSRQEIFKALHGSLERLQTDYIDLYQIHWPDRRTNFFGRMGYTYEASEEWEDNIHEVLSALSDLIKEGKIRKVGISNETPFGLLRYLEESKEHNLEKISTIQNPYSLLNRTFEVGNAEICMRKKVGLLAYSPLGFGVLSGKYLGGKQPENARITLFPNYIRYSSKSAQEATAQYCRLATENGLTPAQMALAFVNHQPFVTSNIIGATTMEQLKENIQSIEVKLSDVLLSKINTIHKNIPNPAP